jgi:hypothetical protein
MDNFGFWITPDCLAMFDDLQRERQKTSDFRNRNRFCITLQMQLGDQLHLQG